MSNSLSFPASAVPAGDKFAFIALKAPAVGLAAGTHLKVSQDTAVLCQPPAVFADYWKEWLGSLQSDQLRDSNLVLLVTEPAKPAVSDVVDPQMDELDRRIQDFLTGVLLHGLPQVNGGLRIAGERQGDLLNIRRVTNVDPIYLLAGVHPGSPTDADFRDGYAIGIVIRSIFSVPDEYPRLQKGLHAWKNGISQKSPDERLHQFVRAVDGTTKLGARQGRKEFGKRGQLFIGQTAKNQELLVELFVLRNCAEHLNELESELTAYANDDRDIVVMIRSFQAEVLAGEVYQRVLRDPALRSSFRDDASTDAFWSLTDTDRQTRFGPPIGLDGLLRARFQDPKRDRLLRPP